MTEELKEKIISETKEKEIHKQLPSIIVSRMQVRSMTDYDKEYYEIKDHTSAAALDTYKKLKGMEKKS